MQIWNERKRLHNSTGFVWKTNMAVVVLFRDTNMAGLASCEKTLYQLVRKCYTVVLTIHYESFSVCYFGMVLP